MTTAHRCDPRARALRASSSNHTLRAALPLAAALALLGTLAGCASEGGDGMGGPDGAPSPDATAPDGGTPDAARAVCGNLELEPGEACDDGNDLAGDGCPRDCAMVEDGWSCPATGACTRVIECGDGMLASSEGCDDGNTVANDGCGADCTVEDGWRCPTPGSPCQATACGDGILAGDEACDDGNPTSFDGCSDACDVESGWVCIGGTDCVAAECGDGILAGDEACDDGDAEAGDGCSADCLTVESNFACPTPGQDCVSTVVCGDQQLGPGEQCDDGDTNPGDGCDADCQREDGWQCPIVGAACVATECGDGIVAGLEICDDGNAMDGDGCSAGCTLEEGHVCTTPGVACELTTCGDGVVEGTEQCDDGDVRPFDGCSESCTNEPMCSGGVCTPICGDGVILPGTGQEACDDGNTRDGDGCSATCEIEAGWECIVETEEPPDTLHLPLVVQDFKGIQWYADDTVEHGHPDFNDPDDSNGSISFGIVEPTLGSDGRPVLSYDAADPGDDTGLPKARNRFAEWYDSGSEWNREEVRTLTLTRQGQTYLYDSTAEGFPPNSTSGFYPIDDGGWVAEGSESLRGSSSSANDGGDHNFNFTTETHFWFQYDGSEVLNFSGDDDLWVFIDGVLCLDVGGLHPELAATMNLANPNAESDPQQRAIVQSCRDHLDGLVTTDNPQPLVEMVIFHAERHTTASNFELELRGFVKQTSTCTEDCGNGVVTRGEVCDDGVNDGGYNECLPGCDGLDGFCGDGEINGPEECDEGTSNNDGSYEGCNPDCTLGPVCGDGIVQTIGDEVCDDGVNDGSYGSCQPDCMSRGPYCGDGTVNGDEACDEGTGDNDGSYDGCNPDCTLGPRCGDGIKQPEEQCDDGNTSSWDGCSANCEFELG